MQNFVTELVKESGINTIARKTFVNHFIDECLKKGQTYTACEQNLTDAYYLSIGVAGIAAFFTVLHTAAICRNDYMKSSYYYYTKKTDNEISQLSNKQKAAFNIGKNTAASKKESLKALLNWSTWRHPSLYYAGQLASTVSDTALLNKFSKNCNDIAPSLMSFIYALKNEDPQTISPKLPNEIIYYILLETISKLLTHSDKRSHKNFAINLLHKFDEFQKNRINEIDYKKTSIKKTKQIEVNEKQHSSKRMKLR